jgi:hypothetical protein
VGLAAFIPLVQDRETDQELHDKEPRFYYNNTLLKRQIKVTDEVFDQICLPAVLFKKLFEMAHDSPVSGHVGADRSFAR